MVTVRFGTDRGGRNGVEGFRGAGNVGDRIGMAGKDRRSESSRGKAAIGRNGPALIGHVWQVMARHY